VSVLDPELPLVLTRPALPALRLLPVPPSEPPYDDELPAARRLPPPVLLPRAAHQALRLVPALRTAETLDDDVDDGPARTPRADLPPARPFAHALVQRMLEVLAGVRPLGQLQRDTTLELYDELERLVRSRPRPKGPRPTRAAVRSVHVQERPEGVAEVCATVQRGGRAGAVALRLEGRGGSWRCTSLVGF
jgi:hypothetical protein